MTRDDERWYAVVFFVRQCMRLDTPTVLQHTIVRCYLTGVAQTSGGLKRASRLRSRSRRHRSRSRRWSSSRLTWESPPWHHRSGRSWRRACAGTSRVLGYGAATRLASQSTAAQIHLPSLYHNSTAIPRLKSCYNKVEIMLPTTPTTTYIAFMAIKVQQIC